VIRNKCAIQKTLDDAVNPLRKDMENAGPQCSNLLFFREALYNTITGTGTFTFTGPSTVGSVASADITATSGDPSGFANAWRVRGPRANLGSGGGVNNGNGWALQAPQYSQGVQFSASTVGYSNITFSFDWFTTTQGVNKLQEQYTVDGTTWININPLLTAVSNGWLATQTINFSGIPGVNNDANFGVRLVSAYDNSLPFPNYGSADGGQNGYYNNNSGKPFFCYQNPTRMHVVTHLSDKYEKTRTPQNGWSLHEAGMAQLDDIVGSVMKKLADMGIENETIVVFTTDNGTENFTWPDGGQTPFAGGKGTVMEGGFRVPCIARWPGKIPAGKVENGLISGLDWFPTLTAAAGDSEIVEELKQGKKLGDTTFKVHLDGYDQAELITGMGPSDRH
jgi:hypothetical protein